MAEFGVNHGCVCKPNRVHEGQMKMGFVRIEQLERRPALYLQDRFIHA